MFGIQWTLAARYLWGRRLRTFLTTLAIVFGALVVFTTNLLLPTMIKAFQTNLLAASGQVDVTVSHRTGEAFPRTVPVLLSGIEGIRVASGSLSRVINIPSDYYHGKTAITALTLTGIDPSEAVRLRSYPIQSGRFLHSGDGRAAVISASLAGNLGLNVGDKFRLPTTDGNVSLKIIGLLPERSLPGNEEILVTLNQAQKLLGLPKRINTIEINLDSSDPARREAIQQQIQAALGDEYHLGALASGSELMASIQMGQMAFNLFGFLALFMGGFIIFNTFRTLVAERRHDIGMLRAIGASRRTIVEMILAEGVLQGLAGALLGMLLGYLLGRITLQGLSGMMQQFMALEIPAPVISPGLVVTTLLLSVGITLLAGLLPALAAGRVTPLEALREPAAETSKRPPRIGPISGAVLTGLAILALLSGNAGLTLLGGLLFLLGLVLLAPALVRPIAGLFANLIALIYARDGTGDLAQSNLTRQPSRAAITASATMIGLAVIVGLGGLIWSMTGGFLGILQRSLGSDYLIMPPSVGLWGSNIGARPQLAADLRAIPGVEAVASMRFAASTADGEAVSLLGIDPTVYPQLASLTFQEGDPHSAYQQLKSERALIANGIFAATAGLKAGDSVRLSTPRGEKIYRIAAVAGDFLNAKIQTAYISQDNLAADFRKDEDVLYQINLSANADPERVEARMQEVLEDYPQFKLTSGRAYFEEIKLLFNAAFAFYFVLLAVLSAPSLIALVNTLAIGVIERTREIGLVRAVGATRRQVRRVVVAESLLLAAIGTLFGLLAGLYLGYVLVLGLSSGGFPIEYVFPTQGLAAALIAGLLFGVLAALVPARQAAQMEIVRALRFE